LAVASVLVPFLLFVLISWRDYHDIGKDLRSQLATTSDLLGEHAKQVLQINDLVAARVALHTQSMSWAQLEGSVAVQQYLQQMAADYVQVDAIWLADASGTVRVGSLPLPTRRVGVEQRDYFSALRDGYLGTYIGSAVQAQVMQGLNFNLARRRVTSDGTFDGVTIVTIFSRTFVSRWQDQLTDKSSVVRLLRSDGALLASLSPDEMAPEARLISPNVETLLASGDSELITQSAHDGKARLYSVRKLGNFNVYLEHGIDSGAAFNQWQAALPIRLFFHAFAAVVLLLLALLALRAATHQVAITRRWEDTSRELAAEIKRRERTQAELALTEHKLSAVLRARMSAIVESAADAMLVVNEEGLVTSWNAAGTRLYGYAEMDMIGQPVARLFAPDAMDANQQALAEALSGKQTIGLETEHLKRGGSTFDVAVTLSPIRAGATGKEPAGQPAEDGVLSVSLVVRDISVARQAQTQLRQSEAHFGFVAESAQALIWLAGTDKLCNWFNKVWLDFTGRTMEQEIGNGWTEGVHPDDLSRCVDYYVRHFDQRQPFSMEYRLRRHDGEYRWILDNGAPRFNEQGEFEGYIGSCFDITERKNTEARILTLNRYYATLSRCNEAIVRSVSEDELFLSICRVAVETAGLKMAWIGLVDADSGVLHPVAHFGEGTEYLDKLHISVLPDDPYGKGPSGTAIRDNKPYWCNDFLNDPFTVPWREPAQRFGWRASASLPLRRQGMPVGALSVYAAEAHAFNPEIRNLLTEVAVDIGFALDNLAREAERRSAEEHLRESEQRYRLLLQNSADGILLSSPDGSILSANPAACRLLGRTEDEICRLGRAGIVDMSDPRVAAFMEERSRTGSASGQLTMIRGDGSPMQAEISSSLFTDHEGRQRTSLIFRDITVRKRAETSLMDQLAELKRWNEVTLGREARIMELKREVNLVLKHSGAPARYASVEAQADSDMPSTMQDRPL